MSGSGEQPPPVLLLHGDLDLTIHEARDLPNMDVLSTLLRCLCLHLGVTTSRPRSSRSVSGDDDDSTHHRHRHSRQPHGHRILPTSDPYATVVVPGPPDTTLARTHVVRNSESPDWSARVLLPLAHAASHLAFQVKDADPFGSDLIGTASLPSEKILEAADKPIDSEWLTLLRPDGRGPPKPNSAIRISATFIPAARTVGWRSGGVPAYFPPRRGCEVKLYQDAHVAAGEVEGVPGVFEPGRCWEDVCMAVLGAQHLVYVVGWSVYTQVRLLREAMSPEMAKKAAEVKALSGVAVEDMNLGELLKYKSQEGVRVCLLVWDDKTSHDNFFLRTRGVMQTHDEDTKRFFKHSSVICALSPRYPSSKLSIAKQKVVGTLYTHHQKCLLVDTPASETTRRITAFLGGLDLCAGRYDTPTHRLFRDLHTVFHGDVYNPTFGVDERGPRQPWHDMHCRLDGPAAYDVLRNFEQRWRKATKLREVFGKVSHWKDDALLKLERISWILSPSKAGAGDRGLHMLPEDDPECWHAQVFRSVDSGSVKGFPRPWETQEMVQNHLLCDKNLAVEQSIHAAYITAIRSAERFIYIENQYFIGSSYAWPSYRHPGAGNLVPMEIALKVASKIKAGEPFAAYVVIPMWPEGNPTSGPAQEILFWQRQTMEMMYKVIAREMETQGLKDAHPQDYLIFCCLGNREDDEVADDDHCAWPPDHPGSTSPKALARRHRRFIIYVHSKGMIVDDEYVIVGSANINQRSLAGSRDTEIAVGAYQPHHTTTHSRGKVYGYRMSLWEEHLGKEVVRQQPELERPESRDCVRLVNKIAWANWIRYTASEGRPGALKGHLIRYPVHVGTDGRVAALQGHETFPDVGGRVLGSTNNLPDYLTM
ncbi:phospholipase D delta-like isoform X3 [Phragmites australis]|uniref:phospholipase D delta-like isoform X3 n=1 Tax=Phragmites australis TaxID=29695 RepID=UPI002D77EAAA|nr:phospholipase D delta-like isoform X3 [Phragmites australis]